MKKFFSKSLLIMGVFFSVVMSFAACGGGDDEVETTLSVSSSSLSADAGQESVTFQVTSNTSWSISGYPSWISVSPSSGQAGTISVNVNVVANSSTDSRNCTLYVTTTDGKKSSYVQIQQAGKNASLSVDPTVTVGSEKGATKSFKIECNTSWTLSGVPDWLNATPLTGDGNSTVTLSTLSANETAEERTATLKVTAGGQTASVKVTQSAGVENVKVIPTNMVSLYNKICFELEPVGNVHKFRYKIYTTSELNRMSDKDIIDDLENQEELTYSDQYIFFPSGFTSNTTYYVCTLAYDGDYNRGELVKSSIKTGKYVDYNNDAYATVNFSWYSSSHTAIAFQYTKQAYCNTYHAIYGTNVSATVAKYSSVLYAFQINYYLEHGNKHWFASNWGLTIQTNYPNDHSFIASYSTTSSYPAIVAYSWGLFQDGSMSTDMIGGYSEDPTSSSSTKRLKLSKQETGVNKGNGITYNYTTLSREHALKVRMLSKRK